MVMPQCVVDTRPYARYSDDDDLSQSSSITFKFKGAVEYDKIDDGGDEL